MYRCTRSCTLYSHKMVQYRKWRYGNHDFSEKLSAILLNSIPESSFPNLLSYDVVIPFPLFSPALSPKSVFGKFVYLPKWLFHFGKRLAQVTFDFPKVLSQITFQISQATFCVVKVVSASTFRIAKMTFLICNVTCPSNFPKITFHVWHGLKKLRATL